MFARFFAIVGVVLVSSVAATAQNHMTSEAIVQQLLPTNTGPMVRSLRGDAKRGINIQGQLPTMVDLPRTSLTVNFELDSAQLTTDGMIALRSLARALKSPELRNASFQIAGHTDGRGDTVYNQTLSERRARAVVDNLTTFWEVSPSRLIPIGYGFSQPMDAGNLMNPLNRRVEIINLEPLS